MTFLIVFPSIFCSLQNPRRHAFFLKSTSRFHHSLPTEGKCHGLNVVAGGWAYQPHADEAGDAEPTLGKWGISPTFPWVSYHRPSLLFNSASNEILVNEQIMISFRTSVISLLHFKIRARARIFLRGARCLFNRHKSLCFIQETAYVWHDGIQP